MGVWHAARAKNDRFSGVFDPDLIIMGEGGGAAASRTSRRAAPSPRATGGNPRRLLAPGRLCRRRWRRARWPAPCWMSSLSCSVTSRGVSRGAGPLPASRHPVERRTDRGRCASSARCNGFRFRHDGACVAIPSSGNPDARIPPRLRLGTVLTEERVWASSWACLSGEPSWPLPDWLGHRRPAARPRSGCRSIPGARRRSRHVENFNDVAHFPYVHAALLRQSRPPRADRRLHGGRDRLRPDLRRCPISKAATGFRTAGTPKAAR